MRIAAIGCGGHATNNVWPNFAPQGIQLAAVCARHLDRAEAAAARFGGQAFDDAAKLLDTVDVDAAVVVVPPDQYASVVRLCLERNVPVFTDKPGAGSAEEAEELASEAAAVGVPVMVGYQKRFGGAVRQAKAIIDGDGFGPLTLGSFKWSMGAMGGGGQVSLRDWLFENPVHHFDLARYLLGELTDVKVNAHQVNGEFALAIGATAVDSGAAVSLRVCTTGSWFQHNESAEVFGFGQSVLVDNVDTCVHRPAQRPELVWRPNYTVPIPINSSAATMGFGTELAEFKALVTEGGPNASDIASAAATLRLTAEIARQAGAS